MGGRSMNEHICPKDCPYRHAICHTICPKHERYRADMAEDRKRRQHEATIKSYQTEQKNRHIEITKQHKTWKGRKTKS